MTEYLIATSATSAPPPAPSLPRLCYYMGRNYGRNKRKKPIWANQRVDLNLKEIYIDESKSRYESQIDRGPRKEKIAKFYARFFRVSNLAILANQSIPANSADTILSALLRIASVSSALSLI